MPYDPNKTESVVSRLQVLSGLTFVANIAAFGLGGLALAIGIVQKSTLEGGGSPSPAASIIAVLVVAAGLLFGYLMASLATVLYNWAEQMLEAEDTRMRQQFAVNQSRIQPPRPPA